MVILTGTRSRPLTTPKTDAAANTATGPDSDKADDQGSTIENPSRMMNPDESADTTPDHDSPSNQYNATSDLSSCHSWVKRPLHLGCQ